jgi:hypothetical protein
MKCRIIEFLQLSFGWFLVSPRLSILVLLLQQFLHVNADVKWAVTISFQILSDS